MAKGSADDRDVRLRDRLVSEANSRLDSFTPASRRPMAKQGKREDKRRKVIVYIATSADGYIARPDGDVEWLSRPRPKGNYGIGAFFKSIDTILWGRKTYSKGIEMGMKDSGMGPRVKNYMFSRRPQASLLPGFEFVAEPIKPFMQRLRA